MATATRHKPKKARTKKSNRKPRSTEKQPQLIWILSTWDSFSEFNFLAYAGGIPRVYAKDKYPYADVTKAPFFDDFTKVVQHFHKNGGEGPVQVAVELLPLFSFGKRKVQQALKMVA